MDSRESSRFTAPLTQRVAEDADSRQIADAIGAMWSDLDAALQPVLGSRGVAALFKRTLHLTTLRYPWLAPLDGGSADAKADLAELTGLFASQRPAIVMEAGSSLFMTFRELINSLIGARLSEQLLQTAWSTSSSASPAQDPTP